MTSDRTPAQQKQQQNRDRHGKYQPARHSESSIDLPEDAANVTDQRWQTGGDHNPAVDGARLRSVLTDQLLNVLPTGFRFEGTVNTGGNCTAFQILAPDGREMLITDGDASIPYDLPDYSTDLMFGYSDTDGATIEAWYLYQTDGEPDPAQVSKIIGAWAGGAPLFKV